MNLEELVEPITALAVEAGNAILTVYATDFAVESKSDESPLTQADLASHNCIAAGLAQLTPDIPVISEEDGLPEFDVRGKWNRYWLVDPLDGTSNYLHGMPHFGISIALQIKGRTEHAVVYDPMRDELFSASRGGGAHMNNTRIRVSVRSSLDNAIVATSFPFRQRGMMSVYTGIFSDVYKKIEDIRRFGAASLDLAWVAAGRMDAYFEIGLKPWDVAAGALLVREAGGVVSDFDDADDLDNAALLELDCDVLIPAAIEDVITAENAPRVRANIIVEGANRPVTSAGDEILVAAGKNMVPDILANAGGVIASYFEWAQNIQVFSWELERVNRELDKKMNEAYDVTKERADRNGGTLRDAAFDVAVSRVAETIKIRSYVG